MFQEVWQVVIVSLGTIITGAGSALVAIWFRSRSAKRVEEISADKTEIDLRLLENQALRELDEDKAKRIIDLIDESRKLREKVKQLLDENMKLIERQTEFELQIIELTRSALVANQRYVSTRCDVLSCCNRIPPFETVVTGQEQKLV